MKTNWSNTDSNWIWGDTLGSAAAAGGPGSVGPSRPTATATDSSNGGLVNITNQQNLTDTDITTAATPLSGNGAVSTYCACTAFGFSVPAGATILGITVTLVAWRTGPSGSIPNIILYLAGATTGTGKGPLNSATTPALNTTHDTITLGGAADMWGATLTAANINSAGFGVAVTENQLAMGAGLIGDIQVTVNYTT